MRTTLYVDTQTGMPRREVEVIVGPNNGDMTPTITDFYDYDAKIEITLPPCG